MLLAAVGGACAGGAAAQAATQQEAPGAALARVIANQSRIRVRLASGQIVELQKARVEGTTLVGRVATKSSVAAYQVEDLEQVWRRGSAAGLGLAIGAGIGVFGGAIGGVALANMCIVVCGRTSGGEQLKGALIGGLVGGVTIGGIGLLMGAQGTRWKTAYKTHQARLTPIVTTHQVGVRLTF